MTFSPIEPIHYSPVHDRNIDVLSGRLSNARNPISNLKNSSIVGANFELLTLARINPELFELLKGHPSLIKLLNENSKLVELLIKSPSSAEDLINDPQSVLSKLSGQKQDKQTEKSTPDVNKLNSLIKSKERRQVVFQKANTVKQLQVRTTTQVNKQTEKVDLNPHRLESEIIAKAHVENPNTQKSLGEFRFISRVDLNKSGLIPHDQELQPNLVTTARAFALNPDLLKMMSGEALALNRTKKLSMTGNPDDDDYEVENETEEALNNKEDVIEEITKVNNAEPVNKILTGLK